MAEMTLTNQACGPIDIVAARSQFVQQEIEQASVICMSVKIRRSLAGEIC